MTAAMMLPTYLPAIRYVLRNTLPGRQGRAAVECVAAYFAVWSVFGFAATLADTAVHQGLAGAANTHLPFVAALVVASVWQITPKKRAFLGGCRTGRVLAAHGWKADAACIRFGVRYAVSCVGSCWALMLVMFAAGAAHLAWMILLAALVWAEKTRPFGYDLARPSAAVLAVAAGVVLLT